jgi:hypothetical protein
MRLLMLLALSLVAVPVLAGDTTPSIFSKPAVTMVHPMPGMDLLISPRGGSVTILHDQAIPGLSYYSQKDQFGNITGSGFLNEPMRPSEPLHVPPVYSMKPFSIYDTPYTR